VSVSKIGDPMTNPNLIQLINSAFVICILTLACSSDVVTSQEDGDAEFDLIEDDFSGEIESELPDGDDDSGEINVIVDGDEKEYGVGEEEYDPNVHALPPLEVANVAGVSGRNVRILWVPTDAECEITIERATDDASTFQVIARKQGKHGRFLDLALQPETWYRYKLTACNNDGCSPTFESIPVKTKISIAPKFNININKDTAEDNVIVFGISTIAYDYTEDGRMVAIDRDGNIIWEYYTISRGAVTEVQPMDNHTFGICTYTNYTHIDLDNRELYHFSDEMLHHDINPISDDRIVALFFDQFQRMGFTVLGDGIVILDEATSTIDWRWYSKDHISEDDRSTMDIATSPFGLGQDWTHSNSIHFDEQESKMYLNVRNLNRIYKIDYPSGDVDWVMGDGGDFGEGLWSHSHSPVYLPNNRVLMFDNGLYRPGTVLMYSRVIEIEYDPENKTAEIVWEYREQPDFYSYAYSSVEIMNNGNILVDEGIAGRVFEVTRDKEIVWEMKLSGESIYKVETVPIEFFTEW